MPKRKFEGFQFPGQVPLENSHKVKAPKGKFIVVEKSENNITGWGYTKISTHPTSFKMHLAVSRQWKALQNSAMNCESTTITHAIRSINVLGIDSHGNVLKVI